MTGLIDHCVAVDIEEAPLSRVTRDSLSEIEVRLLDLIEQDLNRQPKLKRWHKPRKGRHSFIISIGEQLSIGMLAKHQAIHHSKLSLPTEQDYCPVETVDRIVPIACERAGITYEEAKRFTKHGRAFYVYSVIY